MFFHLNGMAAVTRWILEWELCALIEIYYVHEYDLSNGNVTKSIQQQQHHHIDACNMYTIGSG